MSNIKKSFWTASGEHLSRGTSQDIGDSYLPKVGDIIAAFEDETNNVLRTMVFNSVGGMYTDSELKEYNLFKYNGSQSVCCRLEPDEDEDVEESDKNPIIDIGITDTENLIKQYLFSRNEIVLLANHLSIPLPDIHTENTQDCAKKLLDAFYVKDLNELESLKVARWHWVRD